jgi:alpha-L-rhamnosidase
MKLHKPFFVVLFGIVFLMSTWGAAAPALQVSQLKCEYKTNPVGIDVLSPRLSWVIESSKLGVMQAAYEIRAAASEKELKSKNKLVWHSGKVDSDESIHIVYAGSTLKSGDRIYWQVRVWDKNGKKSNWSTPAFWEMGLLNESDWQAKWIRADIKEDVSKSNPAHMLRKDFSLKSKIISARAYVTSLGLYELELNGVRVGEEVLTPGWTALQARIQYQTYDVTKLLNSGDNAVGATLGDGWYRGQIGFSGQRNTYGDQLALLLQLEVKYADGSSETIKSDESWKASTGAILVSDIYDGEVYDARLEKADWSRTGFDDNNWVAVTSIAKPDVVLIAPEGPPIAKIEEIKPIEIMTTPEGQTVVDMGQNMVGWLRLAVQGTAGTKITLLHTEVLDKEGNFYTENLRAAQQKIVYTLKGGGVEEYEPHFTFQGFRYVAVVGWPGELSLDDLTGVVVHSDMPKSGSFECSDAMLNQLQHNIEWGQKGNFVDVPTDCPQRDERLGWTGDAQAFAPTACFNHDVAAFYTKWMKDFIYDQQSEGQIPHVIPDVLSILRDNKGNSASAGWADAAVIVPWVVYQSYGDVRILEQQYDCMKGWVDYQAKRAGDTYFWNTDFTFGDWLSYNTTRSDYPGATTDKDFITQAYFIRSTDLLHRTAKILGKTADASHYADLLAKAQKVFLDEFVTSNGRLSPNTQTAYTLALAFDILPEETAKKAAKRLADDVNKFGHITTGFLGTPWICHVLSDWGYWDEAFMLLNRKKYPSWLYPITKGATTIWERWDGIKPDGSFQNAGMNSFNHYAYGAIGEWLYRVVAGINIDEKAPGYKHSIIAPNPGGELTSANAKVNTMYGDLASGWELTDNRLKLAIEIPANTTASVHLPNAELAGVEIDGQALRSAKQVDNLKQVDSKVAFELGSGQYEISYEMK